MPLQPFIQQGNILTTESFTAGAWNATAGIYQSILRLPFNRELASGQLSRDRFVFYMTQDAHYLIAFARALALTAAKASEPSAQIKLAGSARDAIVVERSLHEGFFLEYGLSPDRFAATPISPTCRAYADFLLATAAIEPYPVALAGILPCFQIYYEVGKHLHGIARSPNPYQRWIDTYRDEAFGDSVREVLALVDAAHEAASPAERRGMHDAHLTATRYEWMFWDSAWRMEAWPA